MSNQKKHTEDFKKEVIAYHESTGKGPREVAKHFDIAEPTFYVWRKLYGKKKKLPPGSITLVDGPKEQQSSLPNAGYKIVRGEMDGKEPELSLEAKVNEEIAKGWRPKGSPFHLAGITFAQSMIYL